MKIFNDHSVDALFRSSPKFMPRWIRDLYISLLKKNHLISQVRFFLYDSHYPIISNIDPSDESWGKQYTVQEFITLVHERLQNEKK